MQIKLKHNIKLIANAMSFILDFSAANIAEFDKVKEYLMDLEDECAELFIAKDLQITIQNELLYKKNGLGEIVCSLHRLNLPPIKPEMWVSVEDKGMIQFASCKFIATMFIKKIRDSGEFMGAFYRYAGVANVIPSEIYQVVSIINEHDVSNKSSENNWVVAAKIKELSQKFPEIVVINQQSPVMGQGDLVLIDNFSITTSIDGEQNMVIEPDFKQIDSNFNYDLKSAINKRDIVNSVYQIINSDGRKLRAVFSAPAKNALQAISDKPKIFDKKESFLFLDNPAAVIPEIKNVVDLSAFSERVIGYGIINAEKISIASNADWTYPFTVKFTNANDEEVCTKFAAKNQIEDFSARVKATIKNGDGHFVLDNNAIPLNKSNIFELEQIVNIEYEDGEKKPDKLPRYITLKDIDNNDIRVMKSCLNGIAQRIQKQLTVDKDNLIFAIHAKELIDRPKSEDIQLTDSNLKLIYKTIKMGLLIKDSGDYNLLIERLIKSEHLAHDPILPPTLLVNLKDHQKYGVTWLQNCYKLKRDGFDYDGVLLADDMGLGKTLQILTFIEWLHVYNKIEKPILIVAPVILLDNWHSEYNRFFRGLNTPFILHGKAIAPYKSTSDAIVKLPLDRGQVPVDLDIEKLKKQRVIVTNYDTLERYETSLCSIDYEVVILDEAQNIKNNSARKSQVSKALKAEFKIAMTGTPVENSLMDFWSILDFLNPQLLLPLQQFKRKYIIDKSPDLNEIKTRLYFQMPYAYMLRRLKSEVLKDLPSKEYIPYFIDYEKAQYDQIRECKNIQIKNPSATLQLLHEINKLHQSYALISNDYNDFKSSNKAKQLIKIIKSIRDKNEKVLVFAILVDMQQYLKQLLEEAFNTKINILNGSSNGSQRQRFLNDFDNNPENFIMVLSPIAAGVGLTIVSANHVIHYSRWWNPAIESQATDRVYRIGQTKSVKIHYLLHKDNFNGDETFDEKVNNHLKNKMDLAVDFLSPMPSQEVMEKEFVNSIFASVSS